MRIAGPLSRYKTWRAQRVWLRDPARALRLLRGRSALRGGPLALLAWLELTYARDEERAEHAARSALEQRGDTRFASAALAELLLRHGEHDAAIDVLRAARDRLPEIAWYELTLADALEEAGRVEEAEALLERALGERPLRRHALKRLSR
ncbi:MAG: Tetratricopeptide repeat, partial [Solirubrobacteraceae bacterium]|nr:Tetratricopeptide repeat [Solirubrobacteraceae bacterium]